MAKHHSIAKAVIIINLIIGLLLATGGAVVNFGVLKPLMNNNAGGKDKHGECAKGLSCNSSTPASWLNNPKAANSRFLKPSDITIAKAPYPNGFYTGSKTNLIFEDMKAESSEMLGMWEGGSYMAMAAGGFIFVGSLLSLPLLHTN